MKNLSISLNIILFIAVGYLYLAEFAEKEEVTKAEALVESAEAKLAYVNSDTLLARYHYYVDVAAKLDEKRQKLQGEYGRKAEALQKQFDDYQRTYLNLTVPQARAVEEDLMQKRQELAQYQEKITQDLMKEEADMTQQLYEKVANYLQDYGKNNELQIVFTYSAGSGLLYANDALDITDKVVQALNTTYASEKKD